MQLERVMLQILNYDDMVYDCQIILEVCFVLNIPEHYANG